MKRYFAALVVFCVFVMGVPSLWAQGQSAGHASVHVPDSSIENAGDVGVRAHTNHLILVPAGISPQASSPQGKTPTQIRSAYSISSGSTGGAGVIAIVDAYDYATAQSDFDTFSSQFGLPVSTATVCNGANPCFKKVYATGVKPRANCGWGQEAALDIEWAHAMAPYAQIVLVEAKSNSFTDLFNAVDVATNEVLCSSTSCPSGGAGMGEVSMSWGGSEFSSEASNDSHFNNSHSIVYFASSGDTGGKTIYPSVSPYVVAAGGTTLNMSGNTFVSETGWSGSGGGPSQYESRPTFQNAIVTIVGSARGVPDYSFDADPSTGVSVFDSTSCQGLSGWLVFGGTSVASPSLSGIMNTTNTFRTSANELSIIYATYNSSSYPSDFRDITSGKAGTFSAGTGWDFVTGIGSNLTLNGK